jgi:Flp pilus assembly pilin Flp
MLKLIVRLQVWFASVVSDDRGQTTAEYALVLLGAAAIALLLVAWATKTNRIGKLLDFVVDQIIGRVT